MHSLDPSTHRDNVCGCPSPRQPMAAARLIAARPRIPSAKRGIPGSSGSTGVYSSGRRRAETATGLAFVNLWTLTPSPGRRPAARPVVPLEKAIFSFGRASRIAKPSGKPCSAAVRPRGAVLSSNYPLIRRRRSSARATLKRVSLRTIPSQGGCEVADAKSLVRLGAAAAGRGRTRRHAGELQPGGNHLDKARSAAGMRPSAWRNTR